jgi:predicted AAA+ superfamily ATPase
MSKAFDFGKIADGFYYTNRDKEAAWLKQQIGSGINAMLISPRRWGKSSLVQQVAEKIKKDDPAVVFCFVDLFNIRSEQEFYEALSRQVLKNTNSNLTEIGKTVGSFFKQIIPKISLRNIIQKY